VSREIAVNRATDDRTAGMPLAAYFLRNKSSPVTSTTWRLFSVNRVHFRHRPDAVTSRSNADWVR